MVKFAEGTQLQANKELTKINILDMGLLLLIMMLTFLVSTMWLVEPDLASLPVIKSIGLSSVMLSLAIFSFLVYFTATLTGTMRGLKLVDPRWIVGAVVAVPVWLVYNAFLPVTSATGAVEEGASNILISVFGAQTFNFIQAVWVYGFIESVVFGILLIFFLGVSQKTKGAPMIIPVFILVVAFMALLHTSVALALDTTGAINFGAVILHQVVAFTIMGIFFFIFGMAGNIASHQIKNTLALGLPFGFWAVLFIIYGLIAFLALRKEGTSPQQFAKSLSSRMRLGV